MKRQILGLALAVALVGAGQAQALLIDDYQFINTPQLCPSYFAPSGQCVASPPITGDASTNLDTGLPYSNTGGNRFGTIGNSRLITLTRLTPPLDGLPPVATAGVAVSGIPGLNVNNPSSTDSRYSATYGPGLGGGAGVNLTLNDLPPGSPNPGGPATHTRFFVQAQDINLLATIILTDADGTVGGNAFLKLPSGITDPPGGDPDGVCEEPSDFIVCVQPKIPGNLYHTLSLFNSGGTDPATGLSFFDSPFIAGADVLLAPAGGVGGLDLAHITQIQLFLETAFNTGSEGLDLTQLCFDTVPLLGTPVANPPGVAGAGNNIGANACTATAIPEPSTVLLMGTGLLGVGLFGVRSHFSRRRRQQA